MAVSPDGERLATGSIDWTAQVWNLRTGEALTEPIRHDNRLVAVKFSPDGSLLATASLDGTARLWDARSGDPYSLPLQHQGFIRAIDFHPDGTLLATASEDGTARVWRTDYRVTAPPLPYSDGAYRATFCPKGDILAVACGKTLQFRHAADGRRCTPPQHCSSRILSVAFSPRGALLATSTEDGILQVWDSGSAEPVWEPIEHPDRLIQVEFSPDGEYLAALTAGSDRTIRFYDPETGRATARSMSFEKRIDAFSFGPFRDQMAIFSGIQVELLDLTTRERLPIRFPRTNHVKGLVFSPDGALLAIASTDGVALICDVATGTPIAPPLRHGSDVSSVAFRPDGTMLATASYDGTARLWDVRSGQLQHSVCLQHTGPVTSVAFSPDGDLLATTDGSVRLWTLSTEPHDPEEMELKTSVALGARTSSDGDPVAIPWQQWRRLRQQLGARTSKHPGTTSVNGNE